MLYLLGNLTLLGEYIMTFKKYILTITLYLISITNIQASCVLENQDERRKPLMVVLHPIGHKAGMIGASEYGKLLSEQVHLLEPDASQYGHAEGLWFPLELGMWQKVSLYMQIRQAEAVLPGIQEFSSNLVSQFSQNEHGFMGGLKSLHDSSELVREASEKGYLDKLVEILAGPLAAAMEPTVTKLDAFIDANLQSRNLTRSDLILCGISMGAIMALHYSFHQKEPCRAVISINGLFVPAYPEKKASIPNSLLFVSGKKDEVIPHWIQKRSSDKMQVEVPHSEIFYSENEGHNGYHPETEQFKKVQETLLKYLR
jgi:predicted esterase